MSKYLDPDEINDAGIIFIQRNDPISTLAMSISKEKYSSMGFYYKTNASGRSETKVLYVEVLKMHRPKLGESGATIEDLVSDDLVTLLSIKKLRPSIVDGVIDEIETRKIQEYFRIAIAKVTSNESKNTESELVYQLLGYRDKSDVKCLSIMEMVNEVVKLMGRSSDVPLQSSKQKLGIKTFHNKSKIDGGIEGKFGLISMFGSSFSQSESDTNKPIHSYSKDNELFGELLNIKLPDRIPIDVKLAKIREIKIYQPILIKMSTIFIDMLLNNQRFFDTLSKGIVQDNVSIEIVRGFSDDFTKLFTLISQSVKSGSLEYSKLLECSSIHNDRKNILGKGCESLIQTTELPELVSNILINVNVKCGNNSRRKLVSSLSNLYDHVSYIKNSVDCDSECLVDINLLSSIVNNLMEVSSLRRPRICNISGDFERECKINVDNRCGTIYPMTMSSGKKIVLNTRYPNLLCYSKKELSEILRSLDNVSVEDEDMDSIRAMLTDILASS
ncbi:MAG: hypothetical protein COA94_02945 [Rickettsiales bacterium]|nr:MAG: hypothetical protein COA94_02945 [Rickettsiales bacterium]